MIITLDKINEQLSPLRSQHRIVFTNGCFDIIHLGHISLLQEVSKLGDITIVAINSDASIRRIKGDQRPIQDEQSRSAVIDALKCVDYTLIFDEDTPLRAIKLIQPDVLVKGGDYAVKDIVGYETVLSNGGEVTTIPLVEGYSTSNIIKKILNNGDNNS